jgi:transcriptional regulator with XRE-family HTH domain
MSQTRSKKFDDARATSRRRAVELAKNDFRLLRDLIRVREARGLSQKDVAEALGITQQAVSKFERLDADPRLSTIRQYAHAVGALVAHAVEADNGQRIDGGWRIVRFTLPQPSLEPVKRRSYHTAAPAKADYAVAA